MNVENLPSILKKKIVIDAGGCWLKMTNLDRNGYARQRWNSRGQMMHRVTYEFFNGEIPIGMEIDHLCRVRNCCNPNHLEAVTHQENVRRGDTGKRSGALQRSKTHCPKDHEYDEANTYRYLDGSRYCRRCRREGMRSK